ncbi:MAG TPA: PorV/PorQ family protein, partial [bacterium]
MGGAYAAVADDVNALEINPAGLAGIKESQITFQHSFWAQDLSMEHLAYGQSLSKKSGLGFGVDYMNLGSVDKILIGPSGPVGNGSYSPMALNVSGGFGTVLLDHLKVGATVKFLMQNIQTTSSATAAIDGGLIYSIPRSGFSFAIVMNNLGGTLDTDSLPLQLTLGAAFKTIIGKDKSVSKSASSSSVPRNVLTLSTEGDLTLNDMGLSNYRVGAEYWYNQQIAAQVGYRFAPYGDLAGVRGFACGVGFRLQKWEVSYALTTQGDMGSTHQISLMTRF